MLNRRTLIQGAFALAATGLLLPRSDLITEAEEIQRFYPLDNTMLRPKPTNWMVAGTERLWGRERILTMSGPLPGTLAVGDIVHIWGHGDGRQEGYRALVTRLEAMPEHFHRGHPTTRVQVTPLDLIFTPRTYQDAIGPWRYVDGIETVSRAQRYGEVA